MFSALSYCTPVLHFPQPPRLMLGFMLPTAFLSMWISNAATAAMMVPILQAVLIELRPPPQQRTMLLLRQQN